MGSKLWQRALGNPKPGEFPVVMDTVVELGRRLSILKFFILKNKLEKYFRV